MMPEALSPLVDAGGELLQPLIYAIVLMLVGFALLIAEIFVVSFGLLMAGAMASMGAAIYFAFGAGTGIGWAFVATSTVVVIVVLRWGLRRIRESGIVPKTEVVADAGYHHAAERIGVAVGSTGVMVTAAFPTGRARFPGGECDVQAEHGPVEIDIPVVVRRIDGPIVFVSAQHPENDLAHD